MSKCVHQNVFRNIKNRTDKTESYPLYCASQKYIRASTRWSSPLSERLHKCALQRAMRLHFIPHNQGCACVVGKLEEKGGGDL